ncbi:hypothetical protein ACIGW7_25885 [Streptomyces sp. NPDC053253]|uniref:hypothetical protein n=1 Tax=Streptomyces sp. NPDC053253 TaxID=3365699 RepID=UPI0037D84D2C
MTALDIHTQVAVSALTGSERTVALYASDMPDRFRAGSVEPSQVAAWIVQGAERIGLEELHRRAEFFYGHRLLEMSNLVPVDVQARHEQQYPKARRLFRAHQTAAGSLWRDPMTPETLARNLAAEVDGECPCRGTRSIPLWMDEDAFVSRACPVHGRATARQQRTGVTL